MTNLTHIVKIKFSMDGPRYHFTTQWVKDRIKLFEAGTLKSLLNQSFQDFRIWVYCGQIHRVVTSTHKWHPRCELQYMFGKDALQKITTSHIAITQLDSDDLLRDDAVQTIDDCVREQLLTNKYESAIFRKGYMWDKAAGLIGRFSQSSPPFFTQIFPRRLYTDWDVFASLNFVSHTMVGKDPNCTELPPNRICYVKHGTNITTGYPHAYKLCKPIIRDKKEVANILKRFGVEYGKSKGR